MNIRESILTADDLPRKPLTIPEWGVTVYVRTMTGSQRDAFEAAQIKDPYRDIRARMATYTVCDESGALLFTEADIPSLGAKSVRALDKIFALACRLNGVSKEDVDELKKI